MSEQKTYYITTPIYYPNDKLHIGHCYTTVACDVMARYKRLAGYDVMFLTGMDEHGQKIQREAESRGIEPQEFVDQMAEGVKHLWEVMNISYDRFIRTTDPMHISRVQEIFKRLQDNGDIYKDEYEGWYCTPCESFWTETQVGPEHVCPDCGRPVELTKEESYFFRLSKYQDRLEELYKSQPEFAEPASRRNEMINNFLKPGLMDLAVSRSTFDWGVPVPGDPKHVIYVWVDALSNYITALGFPDDPADYERYWPADVHMMAKEIFRFHSIIWPAILMSLNIPLPKKTFGHGWLLFDGNKMSKSVGNVVDPNILCDRYGVDPIRFLLMRDVVFGMDGNFSAEALIERTNTDLANDLGNLLSRSTAMFAQYFGGEFSDEREVGEHDDELLSTLRDTATRYHQHLEALEFHLALEELWKLVRRSNKYIDETEPWVLGRGEGSKARLASVLENLLEVLRHISLAIYPFMPDTSIKMLDSLKLRSDMESIIEAYATLGQFNPPEKLAPIEAIKPLFPRLDVSKELEALEEIKQAMEKKTEPEVVPHEHKEVITYDDFMKMELRVAKVLTCEKVEKADKLLRFDLDLGRGETRQVVSGIAEHYKPEDLVGREVVYLANLAGRKIRGILSEGMILSAEDEDGHLILLKPETLAGAGSEIS